MNGLPITRIETIADGTINPAKVGFGDLRESDCADWLLQDGDILISHINSTKHLGKCAIYEGDPPALIHGMNLLALRVNPDVAAPRYVYWMLSSTGFRRQLPRITKNSVNQSSFNISSFKKLQIPLPPLAEQKRIAQILDKADALRAKRRAALAQSRHPHPIHLPRHVRGPRHESEGVAGGGAAESRSSDDRRYAAKREGRDVRWRHPVHYARGP